MCLKLRHLFYKNLSINLKDVFALASLNPDGGFGL
jgi:hypothetical protein